MDNKKFFLVSVLSLGMFTFVSCGDDDGDDNSNPDAGDDAEVVYEDSIPSDAGADADAAAPFTVHLRFAHFLPTENPTDTAFRVCAYAGSTLLTSSALPTLESDSDGVQYKDVTNYFDLTADYTAGVTLKAYAVPHVTFGCPEASSQTGVLAQLDIGGATSLTAELHYTVAIAGPSQSKKTLLFEDALPADALSIQARALHAVGGPDAPETIRICYETPGPSAVGQEIIAPLNAGEISDFVSASNEVFPVDTTFFAVDSETLCGALTPRIAESQPLEEPGIPLGSVLSLWVIGTAEGLSIVEPVPEIIFTLESQ